jgi:hypothetical protein
VCKSFSAVGQSRAFFVYRSWKGCPLLQLFLLQPLVLDGNINCVGMAERGSGLRRKTRRTI